MLLRRGIMQSASESFNFANVFKTSLYTGNGSSQQLVTGLDFVNKNGLTWHKRRDLAQSNILFDTIRDQTVLFSDRTDAENADSITYNTDGVTLGATGNTSGGSYVVWQWLAEQGFFDIVKYVGDSTPDRQIPHGLNGEIGHLVVKNLTSSSDWRNWHKGYTTADYLSLNNSSQKHTFSSYWGNNLNTDTHFNVGISFTMNEAGSDHIAYLFAHNPNKGVFCGSYTGTGVSGNKQTTGFPVGLILIKSEGVESWRILDKTRNPVNPVNLNLNPDLNGTEVSLSILNFLSDGFDFNSLSSNSNGQNYIYIAIADPDLF